MSRIHYWQFLVDETGVPIEDAEIYVYLAGVNSSANIFSSQTSTTVINSVPSGHIDYDILTLIKTNSNGYFSFWIEDEWGTVAPYTTSQLFKVSWYKVGTVDAFIDNITVFPTIIHPVDETDTDTTLDKLVSNNLAKSWNDHITSTGEEHSYKTDSYVVLTTDLGKSLRMNSADDKNFTLPSMGANEDGGRVTFIKQGAGKMTMIAVDTDAIDDSSAAGTIYTETNYATLTLEYVHGMTRWVIISANGTFTTT